MCSRDGVSRRTGRGRSPFAQLERFWRRDDVAVREKARWRLLYEIAALAGEVLSLNVEDLELENERACAPLIS